MKSKTSFFNAKLYLQDLRRAWPVGLAYLIFLLVWLPYFLFLQVSGYNSFNISSISYEVASNMALHMEAVSVMIFSVIAVVVVFSFLYHSRSAYMMHSFPVTRLQMFTSGMAAVLTLMWVPQIITALVTLGVIGFSGTGLGWLAGWWLVTQMLTTVFFTALAAFAAIFSGQGVTAVFFYVVLNFIFTGFSAIWALLESLFFYGIAPSLSTVGVLTPVVYITEHTGIVHEFNSLWNWTGARITGGLVPVFYALAGIGFMVITYLVYSRRHVETAGDFISEKWLKPVFKIGAAACFSLGIAAAATLVEWQSGVISSFWQILAAMLIQTVIIGFIVYFAAEMIIWKSFRVFSKRQWLLWGIFSVCAAVFIIAMRFDVLGVQTRVPDPDKIDRVVFTAFGDSLDTAENKNDVVDIHYLIADDLETIRDEAYDREADYSWDYPDDDYTTVSFTYFLNDGSVMTRSYSIFADDGPGEAVMTAANELLCRPENFDAVLMNGVPEDAVLYDVSMNLFVRDGEYPDEYDQEDYVDGEIYAYDNEEIYISFEEGTGWNERLLAALRQDFEEGHIDFRKTPDKYQNVLDLCWHSNSTDRGSYIEGWGYTGGWGAEEYYCSIRLSPECVHTLAVLRESEQFFEEGLITRAEYFAY